MANNRRFRDTWRLLAALAVLLGGFLIKWIGSGLSLGAVLLIFLAYVAVCALVTAIWLAIDR